MDDPLNNFLWVITLAYIKVKETLPSFFHCSMLHIQDNTDLQASKKKLRKCFIADKLSVLELYLQYTMNHDQWLVTGELYQCCQ